MCMCRFLKYQVTPSNTIARQQKGSPLPLIPTPWANETFAMSAMVTNQGGMHGIGQIVRHAEQFLQQEVDNV